MKALVTGITGFVGSHLAEHLLHSGDQVLGFSSRDHWPEGTSAALESSVPILAWDLASSVGPPANLRHEIARFSPDCIYHLAALSVPSDCGQQQPTAAAQAINVAGTSRVVELAQSFGKPLRILLASTSHVYAPVGKASPPVTEEAPVAPWRGYGITKLAAEKVVLDASAKGLVEAVVARAFQHTGPRQQSRMMLPEWCRQIAERGTSPIQVVNCDTMIDLSDVRDVVRAYRLLVERGQSGQVYNVGSGIARRTGDVLNIALQLAGTDRGIDELRPGEKYDPIADVSRVERQTGWTPRIALEKTVRDTLEYWSWQHELERPAS